MNAKFLVAFSFMFVPRMAVSAELRKAVATLDVKKLEKLADRKVRCNVQDSRYELELHFLASIPRGKFDPVEPEKLPGILKSVTDLLLQAGAKPYSPDNNGRTAVHAAISKNSIQVWGAFYDKMLQEMARGEIRGPWTKCLDVGSAKSLIDGRDPTPLAAACYLYPWAKNREITKEIVYDLVRIQASRFGDDFRMNEKMTSSLVLLYMGSGHNEEDFLKNVKKGGVNDFETFFTVLFEKFKRSNGLENPKMDGIEAALSAYEEKNVYPFYLWVRDRYVWYKRVYLLNEDDFVTETSYDGVTEFARKIRDTDVLDFEKELFRHKAEIANQLREFGTIVGKTVFLDEDAVLFSIIRYEIGAQLEDIKNVLKNWPKPESSDSNPPESPDSCLAKSNKLTAKFAQLFGFKSTIEHQKNQKITYLY